ncbi:hypothetical protein D081_0427 [Anaerovibrio sp. JC8]|uniref:hypothetical protein n=1 Tax=Anaerovibrio sp. JC8 TaxID=1240085 RepID=UPI000A09EBBA|nr:hypothetical protein [Anaerovibrio sp. JC8]ORU00979.1 hypothetical protein D081_0427 [Anaerovibrio sp. JC8]
MNVKKIILNKWLVSIVVFLVAAGGVYVGLMGMYHYIHKSNMEDTQRAADQYGASLQYLTRDFAANTIYLAGVAERQRANDAWFVPAAQSAIQSDGHVAGVQYTPAGRPPMSYPAGFSFASDQKLAAVYAKMQDMVMSGDGESLAVGPVTRQDGSMVVIAMSPVLAYNNRTAKFDYIGNVAEILKMPDAIEDDSYKALMNSGYDYALYGNNKDMEHDGLIGRSEGDIGDSFASSSARVPGGYWQIKLAPQDSWTQQGSYLSLGVGVVMGLLLAALTFLTLKGREPKKLVPSHANRELDSDTLPEEISIEDIPEEELDDMERALLQRRRFHQQFRQSNEEGAVVEYELPSLQAENQEEQDNQDSGQDIESLENKEADETSNDNKDNGEKNGNNDKT